MLTRSAVKQPENESNVGDRRPFSEMHNTSNVSSSKKSPSRKRAKGNNGNSDKTSRRSSNSSAFYTPDDGTGVINISTNEDDDESGENARRVLDNEFIASPAPQVSEKPTNSRYTASPSELKSLIESHLEEEKQVGEEILSRKEKVSRSTASPSDLKAMLANGISSPSPAIIKDNMKSNTQKSSRSTASPSDIKDIILNYALEEGSPLVAPVEDKKRAREPRNTASPGEILALIDQNASSDSPLLKKPRRSTVSPLSFKHFSNVNEKKEEGVPMEEVEDNADNNYLSTETFMDEVLQESMCPPTRFTQSPSVMTNYVNSLMEDSIDVEIESFNYADNNNSNKKNANRATASPSVLRNVLDDLDKEEESQEKRVDMRTTASPSTLKELLSDFQDNDDVHTPQEDKAESFVKPLPPIVSEKFCPHSGIPVKEMNYHVPRTPCTRGRTPSKTILTDHKGIPSSVSKRGVGVSFGSPKVAIFKKDDPIIQMTPLSKHMGRLLYPEKTSPLHNKKDDQIDDEETSINSAILAAWEEEEEESSKLPSSRKKIHSSTGSRKSTKRKSIGGALSSFTDLAPLPSPEIQEKKGGRRRASLAVNASSNLEAAKLIQTRRRGTLEGLSTVIVSPQIKSSSIPKSKSRDSVGSSESSFNLIEEEINNVSRVDSSFVSDVQERENNNKLVLSSLIDEKYLDEKDDSMDMTEDYSKAVEKPVENNNENMDLTDDYSKAMEKEEDGNNSMMEMTEDYSKSIEKAVDQDDNMDYTNDYSKVIEKAVENNFDNNMELTDDYSKAIDKMDESSVEITEDFSKAVEKVNSLNDAEMLIERSNIVDEDDEMALTGDYSKLMKTNMNIANESMELTGDYTRVNPTSVVKEKISLDKFRGNVRASISNYGSSMPATPAAAKAVNTFVANIKDKFKLFSEEEENDDTPILRNKDRYIFVAPVAPLSASSNMQREEEDADMEMEIEKLKSPLTPFLNKSESSCSNSSSSTPKESLIKRLHRLSIDASPLVSNVLRDGDELMEEFDDDKILQKASENINEEIIPRSSLNTLTIQDLYASLDLISSSEICNGEKDSLAFSLNYTRERFNQMIENSIFHEKFVPLHTDVLEFGIHEFMSSNVIHVANSTKYESALDLGSLSISMSDLSFVEEIKNKAIHEGNLFEIKSLKHACGVLDSLTITLTEEQDLLHQECLSLLQDIELMNSAHELEEIERQKLRMELEVLEEEERRKESFYNELLQENALLIAEIDKEEVEKKLLVSTSITPFKHQEILNNQNGLDQLYEDMKEKEETLSILRAIHFYNTQTLTSQKLAFSFKVNGEDCISIFANIKSQSENVFVQPIVEIHQLKSRGVLDMATLSNSIIVSVSIPSLFERVSNLQELKQSLLVCDVYFGRLNYFVQDAKAIMLKYKTEVGGLHFIISIFDIKRERNINIYIPLDNACKYNNQSTLSFQVKENNQSGDQQTLEKFMNETSFINMNQIIERVLKYIKL